MNNNFSVTFGLSPTSYINRDFLKKQVYDDFTLDYPLSHIYIICGVRGSGKTVLLNDISNDIKKDKKWILIDINPDRDILEQIASGLYENRNSKYLFLSKTFSFSFHGLGISIEGKEPVSNVKTIIEKMLDVVKKNDKRVLFTIDEASNNSYMRAFAHDFQGFLRNDYPVFTLMTGLYENVNSLQNNKNLTFLYRAPKIELVPLDLNLIEIEYQKIFSDASKEELFSLANLTKGYAFAYQVAGFLFSKYGKIEDLIDEFDKYMSIYVYAKIWSGLPEKEKMFLKVFNDDLLDASTIMTNTNLTIKEYSVYRDRLIKRGIIEGTEYGKCRIILPRFVEFVKKQL